MRRLAAFALLLVCPVVAADGPPWRVTPSGWNTAEQPFPAFDKGYLLFPIKTGHLMVHAPGGSRVFDQVIMGPNGQTVWRIYSASIDTDGTVAAATAYKTPHGIRGGVVFLDASGNQTRFVETDELFQPMLTCFDENHSLWVFGLHWDRAQDSKEDRDPYLLRRFTKDGEEQGRYLLRSQFGSPFHRHRGHWQVSAAKGRIGVITKDTGPQAEFLELDLSGNLVGRWHLGQRADAGYAYIADGRLFAKRYTRSGAVLLEFDRTAEAWVAVKDVSATAGGGFHRGLLVGAVGNELVFSGCTREYLLWVPPPPQRVRPSRD